MVLIELPFDVVSKLRYNENDKDHDQMYYEGQLVYRALVVNKKLHSSGPLTNGHLPISHNDEDIKFFTCDFQLSCENVHNLISKIYK